MFENKISIKEYDAERFIGELKSLTNEKNEEEFINVLINVIEKYNPRPVDMLNRLQLLHYYSDDVNRKNLIGQIIDLISG